VGKLKCKNILGEIFLTLLKNILQHTSKISDLIFYDFYGFAGFFKLRGWVDWVQIHPCYIYSHTKKKATQLKVICRVYVFYFKSHQKGIIFVLCLIIVRQLKRLF